MKAKNQKTYVNQLAYLARLRSEGVISQEQYATAKQNEEERFELEA